MSYKKISDRKVILENGSVYYGTGFGSPEPREVELVFNTSCVGYQEIISDPSYTDQGVVMAYPLIGNYGMACDDYECLTPTIGALIVREYNGEPSNFRSEEPLEAVMNRYGIAGISDIDTRRLVREIRDYGSCRAVITRADADEGEALNQIRASQPPRDAVSRVSRPSVQVYGGGALHVVAVDCGMKENIIRSLAEYGCKVSAVPWNTPAGLIEAMNPDGVFFSNGPGDPTDVPEVIETARALHGKFPIFGICLGHQILSLSYGAKTYKLKFGHRGGNHPVKNLITGKIEITSQNHSYAVDSASLTQTGLTATHINLLDNTVEGVMCERDRAFGVQYHPESAPGPQDSRYLFDRFISMMKEAR